MKRVMMAAALAVATMSAAPAQATDFVQDAGTGRGTSILKSGPIGQSFTMVGTALTSFGFQFQTIGTSAANASLSLTLLKGDGLTGAALKQISATPTAGAFRQNFWYDFDLGGLSLTAGDTYTAVLGATTDRLALVYGPSASGTVDGYAGGRLIPTSTGFNTNSNCGKGICDANFRFTSTGSTGAVPEPATWTMLTLGFGAIGYMLRRRQGGRTTRQLV